MPQDDAEAVRWYRLAAEQGEAIAQNNLGLMYSNGWGVPQDYAEAIRWYRLLAEQGKAGAQNNLGVMYDSNGRGVPQDLHLPRAGQFCGRRRSQAGSPPSQVRPSPTKSGQVRLFGRAHSATRSALSQHSSETGSLRTPPTAKQSSQSRQGGDEGGFSVQFPGVLPE